MWRRSTHGVDRDTAAARLPRNAAITTSDDPYPDPPSLRRASVQARHSLGDGGRPSPFQGEGAHHLRGKRIASSAITLDAGFCDFLGHFLEVLRTEILDVGVMNR